MDGMSLDVLKNLQATAVAADGAKGKVSIIEAPQLGAGKSLIVGPDGKYEIKDQVAVRYHKLGNVMAVINWIVYASQQLAKNPVLWVHTNSLRVVMDDKDETMPRPVIVYELKETPEYTLLKLLAKEEKPYDQKQFIRLLRNQLWDTLDMSKREGLVKILRALKFQDNMGGRSNVSGSRESLGIDIQRSVESEVGDLPETLNLQVRLFQDNALKTRQKVEADLEVSVGTKPAFSLLPISSDLDEALENEVEALYAFLKSKLPETPIFRGVYQGKGDTC